MNRMTAIAGWALAALLAAALAAVYAGRRSEDATPPQTAAAAGRTGEPIYWVAPMDPDYRRDAPGKSPMGMDLVPVFADDGGGATGIVQVAPEVVNNLGVRTALAERGVLRSVIRTVGYVQYDEDRLIHIHPRVTGWVEQLHVKAAGDPVQAGQALYELYSPELVNAQEELLLALNRDNERLLRAADDRLRALQISGEFIAELRRSRQVRQAVTFYAPQSGVVDNLNIREGFHVQPGTTLMSIGALDHVWVEAEVFERQAALVRRGMPASMTLAYRPGRQWSGSVDYVYPTLDEQTRTLRVRLRFDNADGVLRPNMFATVVLQGDGGDATLLVPRESVIRTGHQDRVVLALGDGRFRSVAVTTGRSDERSMAILSGISAGDRVVTSAQFLLDSESSRTSGFQRMQPQDQGGMDHDMDHGGMDHDGMDHDTDHGGMDHGVDRGGMDRDMDHGGMDRDMDHDSMDHGVDHDSMDHDMDHDGMDRDTDHGGMDRDTDHDGMDHDTDHGGMDHHSGQGGTDPGQPLQEAAATGSATGDGP